VLRLLFLRLACISVALIAGSPCFAADGPRFETYLTGQYSGRAVGVTTGTVWSPFGSVEEPGLRLKLDSCTNVYGNGQESAFSSAFMAADFKMLAALMAGYQAHLDQIWVKVYAGAARQAQSHLYWQVGRSVQDQGYGAAIAIEGFWRGRDGLSLSGAASWLQFDTTVSFYQRAAYEVVRIDDSKLDVSTGLELGAVLQDASTYSAGKRLDGEDEFVKAGAVLNIRYWSHELTLSGGVGKGSEEGIWRPYATLSYGKKF
jgi:hypothetical protein